MGLKSSKVLGLSILGIRNIKLVLGGPKTSPKSSLPPQPEEDLPPKYKKTILENSTFQPLDRTTSNSFKDIFS